MIAFDSFTQHFASSETQRILRYPIKARTQSSPLAGRGATRIKQSLNDEYVKPIPIHSKFDNVFVVQEVSLDSGPRDGYNVKCTALCHLICHTEN